MGSGMGSGLVLFEVYVPWARAPEVVRVERFKMQQVKQVLLASQNGAHGANAEVCAVHVKGVRADLVFNQVPDEHIGCCAPWRNSLPQIDIPPSMQKLGKRVEKTEERAMSLSQLEDLDDFVITLLQTPRPELKDRDGNMVIYGDKWKSSAGDLNMYTINELIVKPLTHPFRSSFMELVSAAAQRPKVFMSHAWSIAWKETVRLLKFYAEQRFPKLTPEDIFIWICTFANNQHDLGELGGGLMETPFVRAIRGEECVGTVVVLDEAVTPFKRVWCVLEAWVSLEQREARGSGAGFLYDFLAPSDGDPTALLDAGAGQAPREATKIEGDSFPGSVAQAGMRINIETATASKPEDQQQIIEHVQASDDGCEGLDGKVREWFVSPAAMSFAKEGDVAALEGLLKEWPLETAMRRNALGFTPVWAAARHSHTACLDLLLCSRADPSQPDNDGETPPVWATTFGGSLACLELLLCARADPWQPDNDGRTPVRAAASGGSPACLELLLRARADPSQPDNDGFTPAWCAASNGSTACLKLLLGARADPSQLDNEGRTPVWTAASSGSVACLEILLGARADPSQLDNDGRTPAWAAASSGSALCLKLLLGARADASQPDNAPAEAAARRGRTACLELLVAAGAARP